MRFARIAPTAETLGVSDHPKAVRLRMWAIAQGKTQLL